jgi:hypothetical protein
MLRDERDKAHTMLLNFSRTQNLFQLFCNLKLLLVGSSLFVGRAWLI